MVFYFHDSYWNTYACSKSLNDNLQITFRFVFPINYIQIGIFSETNLRKVALNGITLT